MNDSTETPTPAPVADAAPTETLVAAGFTSGGVVASENPTTQPVAASTAGSSETPGESSNAVVSAETPVAPQPVSGDMKVDILKPVPMSPEPSPEAAHPVVEADNADVEGYTEKLKNWAKRLEIEVSDELGEIEKKLSDYSVDLMNEIKSLKVLHGIK